MYADFSLSPCLLLFSFFFSSTQDQRTRECLVSLWESCEDGKLELSRKLLLDNPSVTPTNPMEPWQHVGMADITSTRRLSCLHFVARGAGRCCRQAKEKLNQARKRDKGAKGTSSQLILDTKMNGYRQIAALLLRRGGKSSARDVNGMTPLMVAAMEGASGIIRVLVTGQAVGNGSMSTLDRDEKEENRVEDLLEAEDVEGNTAMHYAMAFRQIACANALEALGAEITAENKRGETPISVAGIKSQLAKHLRKEKKKSLIKTIKMKSMPRKNYREDREEDREEEEERGRSTRPAPPSRDNRSSRPSRPAAAPPSRPSARNDREEDEEMEAAAAQAVLKSSARETRVPGRRGTMPPSRPMASATDMLKAAAGDLDDVSDDDDEEETSSSSPVVASRPPSKPGLSSTTDGVRTASRPARRPTGRSRTATSALQQAAAGV